MCSSYKPLAACSQLQTTTKVPKQAAASSALIRTSLLQPFPFFPLKQNTALIASYLNLLFLDRISVSSVHLARIAITVAHPIFSPSPSPSPPPAPAPVSPSPARACSSIYRQQATSPGYAILLNSQRITRFGSHSFILEQKITDSMQ